MSEVEEILFSIIAGLEPYDARDTEYGMCVVCFVDEGVPHKYNCGYKLGLDYLKRIRPDIWPDETDEVTDTVDEGPNWFWDKVIRLLRTKDPEAAAFWEKEHKKNE